MSTEQNYSESSSLADDDVVADLVAHREELRIVIHELEVSVPSVVSSLVGLQLSIFLFLGAIALLLAP